MNQCMKVLRNRFNMLCYFFRRRGMMRRYAGGPVSILSNNCLGALICHDLGIKFDTPTVNLWMTCDDFLDFMENLPTMLKEEVVEVTGSPSPSPVGRLAGQVTLNFTHYPSFDEAKSIWNRRRERVDFQHMVVVMADNSNLSDAAIERFKCLPNPKKMFVQSPHTKSLVIVFPRKAQKARNGDREWRFVVASISRRLVRPNSLETAVFLPKAISARASTSRTSLGSMVNDTTISSILWAGSTPSN